MLIRQYYRKFTINILHDTNKTKARKKKIDIYMGKTWTAQNSTNAKGLVWFDGAYRHFQQYFSYIMAVSLLVEVIGGPGENHRPVASHWQTLWHNDVHLALIEIRTHNITDDSHWLHRYSCKSNYHTITARRPPKRNGYNKDSQYYFI